MILDGDSRDLEGKIKSIAEGFGHSVQPLFLPGDFPPEHWIWRILGLSRAEYAPQLGLDVLDMESAMIELDRLAEGAVKQQDAARTALGSFAAMIHREVPEIARIVGRTEAGKNSMPEFLVGLREQIGMWRKL